MERHSRAGKTFQARMGPVRIERSYCYCRECGLGFHQLDRTLGLEGRMATPGAESLYTNVASSDSCGQARRKLRNLAGVGVPKTMLLRRVARDRRGDAGVRAGGRAAKTREAKVIVCRESDSSDPKAGEPRTDKTGRAADVRIDSAQAVKIMFQKFCKMLSLKFGHGKSFGFAINHPLQERTTP